MIKSPLNQLSILTNRVVIISKILSLGLLLFLLPVVGNAQNNCLNFDGSNDYVDLGTISPADNFSNGFTFMGWIKWTESNTRTIFDFGAATAGQNNILLTMYSNSLSLTNYPTNVLLKTGFILNANQWVHVAVTITVDGTANIYINGASVASGNVGIINNSLRTNCYLGKRNWSAPYFKGSMDEISIWTKVLTDSEIQNNMYSSFAGTETNLYAYYNFNQGTAGGNNTGLITLTDATANAKNGTLYGFALTGSTSNWIEVPTYVTNFTGSWLNNVLKLNWGDVIGQAHPDGYYIYASKDNTFTEPVNGTEPTIDNNLGDGSGVVKVSQGVQTYNAWTNSIYNATYHFRIYPYYNSGSSIIFNTAPPLSVTTCYVSIFNRLNSIYLPNMHSGVTWGDYNNDGKLDLMIGEQTPANFKLYKNLGTGNFVSSGLLFDAGMSQIAWLDYNNDGYLDVIISGQTQNDERHLDLYKNNGNETFTKQTNMGFTSVIYSSVAVADYDKDGDLDLIVSGQTTIGNITTLYRNNYPVNSFTAQTNIVFDNSILQPSISWGDYDKDGYPDLLYEGMNSNKKYFFNVYHNNGNNTFTNQFSATLNYGNSSIDYLMTGSWGDYNNDGYPDFFVATSNEIKIFKNNKVGSFDEQTSLANAGGGSAQWGDIDNDGDLDIVASGTVNVFINNYPQNSFTGVQSIQNATTLVTLADYDNDGDLDLCYSNGNNLWIADNCIANPNVLPAAPANLTVQSKSLATTFSWDPVTTDATPASSMSYNVRIGTNSGWSDVVSSMSLSSGSLQRVSIGNAGLSNSFTINKFPSGTYYWSVQAVDNNYGGGAFSEEKQLILNPAQPVFTFAKPIGTEGINLNWNRGNGSRCIVFCKEGVNTLACTPVDNRMYVAGSIFGQGDMVGTTGWYCVYNGSDTTTQINGLMPGTNYTLQIVEYLYSETAITYFTSISSDNYCNISTCYYSSTDVSSSFIENGTVAWGDYNNDGYLDYIITGSGITKLFKNLGNNKFEGQTTINAGGAFSGTTYGAVAWADYDNDGDLDLIITGAGVTKICKNNFPLNSFSEQTDITNLPGLYYSSVAWGDFDNDGKLDLIICGENQAAGGTMITRIYRNESNPLTNQFTLNSDLTGVYYGSVAWGDYDNDGYLDILISGATKEMITTTPPDVRSGYTTMKIYHNNGNNTFIETSDKFLISTNYGAEYWGIERGSVAWGDYDNDGDLDILFSGGFTGYSSLGTSGIFQNNGVAGFTQKFAFNGVNFANSNWLDYNNDGLLDFVITGQEYVGSSIYRIGKIYINTNGGFIEEPNNNITGVRSAATSTGDYDNDGDVDILLGGNPNYTGGSPITKIYSNNLTYSFSILHPNKKPKAPVTSTVITPGKAVLKWIPDNTDESPVSTLTYNLRFKNITSSIWQYAPMANDTGLLSKPTPGNNGFLTSRTFNNLAVGQYCWQVQAVDQGFKGGAWSSPITVEVKDIQAFYTFSEECRGSETQFTDLSTPQDKITWLWKFPNDSIRTDQNPKYAFATSGAHQVWLVITSTELQDANGKFLKDSVMHTVNVKPSPKASYTAPNVCQGSETIFTNNTDMDGIKAKSWKWFYGNGETSTDSVPLNKTYGIAKSYFTKMIVVATNDCADSSLVNSIVAAIPSAVITVSQDSKFTFCKESSDGAYLSLTPQENCTYKWKNNSIEITGKTDNFLNITGNDNEGIYSITATVENSLVSGGCPATSSTPAIITINKKTSKHLVTTSINNFCFGTEVELKVTNSSSTINYQWKRSGVAIDGANQSVYKGNLYAGDYTVEAEPGSCASESEMITLTTKPAPPKPNLIAWGPNVWIIVCDNTTAKDYRWYYNDNLIVGAKTNQYVARQTFGSYYVEVNDGGECYTASDIRIIPDGATGVADELFSELITTYPNPTEGDININLGNTVPGELRVELVSSLGVTYKSFTVNNSSEFSTNINGLPSGLYYCKLYYKKSVVVKKIVKL